MLRSCRLCVFHESVPIFIMDTLHSVIAIGMKRSLPVTVALGPTATVATPADLKDAVGAIAGTAISEHVGAIMNYSYLGPIHNLDMDIPSQALSSPADFPGVRVF
jgi:hypothetical protein